MIGKLSATAHDGAGRSEVTAVSERSERIVGHSAVVAHAGTGRGEVPA
ncbi:hypothetical protein ACFY2R_19250 [Micromonospora olivasterospora]|uniref:Uncharacterized protein n=1 Tax=Micromonospora olivasterospora TaxID=1880 RepID=A0A562IG01_MICOL|nr:hypothetical protein [Micromonospora olivasterospora]TWH69673.1 hypothetical protein JD77_04683 [Micromonospora olivasterospora]